MSGDRGAPFRGFRDHSESPFFRAGRLTPEETWEFTVDRLASLLVSIGALARAGSIEMSVRLLCDWHREIFGALFPEHAGRLRGFRHGEWEHVTFGVGGRPHLGTSPRGLPRRLAGICTEFNASAMVIRQASVVETYDAVHACTRLYVKVLRAHPWIDGNLRTAYVALNAALLTLELPRVEFHDLELHDRLLEVVFAGRHDPYRALAEHITNFITAAE